MTTPALARERAVLLCDHASISTTAPGLELVTGHNTTHHQHDTEPELQHKNLGVAVYKLLIIIKGNYRDNYILGNDHGFFYFNYPDLSPVYDK